MPQIADKISSQSNKSDDQETFAIAQKWIFVYRRALHSYAFKFDEDSARVIFILGWEIFHLP